VIPLSNRRIRSFVAVFAISAASACGRGAVAAGPPPARTVSVVQVQPETVKVSSQWIATMDGLVNAQIRPQVSGYLVTATYREGAAVRKGDVLFEIDPRPFQAVLAQAEAQLAQAQAQLKRTELDVARDKPMIAERAIPQSQFDNDTQANLAAQATVKVAEAALANARLNLEFTKVRSLVNGIAGIATAQIGDLVGPQTLLTTVSQVDPIRVFFSINEKEYLQIADRINTRGRATSLWGHGSDLSLVLADGQTYAHKGRFLAADRQIDARTGTIRLAATFANPDARLRPGQYGKVTAETGATADALLVPLRAVSELQGTWQIRVVTPAKKIDVRTVVLGARSGSRVVVEKGLNVGDLVVVDSGSLAQDTEVETQPWSGGAAPAPAASTSPAPVKR
jgi:RND family efflux transporter MFP subunit